MRRLITLTLTLTLAMCFPPVSVSAEDINMQDSNESASITNDLMRFAGNIHQFNSIFPQEKVYLQFDNTSYYAGETIWFKAFVVNASTLKRAQSRVLYVDLISPTGVLLKQQKLKVVAGQADGSFPLMDGATEQSREKMGVIEYPSGFYEIRAYTNYMLNFNEETVFSRVFAVYEKPKKEGNYYVETPTIRYRWEKTQEEIRPETEKLHKINCEFYPEGGHLVLGKSCRVAFKVTDDTGFGIDADGVLDDTDVTFSTVHDGMGWFTFTPTTRRSSVTLNVDDKSKSFSLPIAEVSGVTLQVDVSDTDEMLLRIDCTPELAGETLGVAITCRGELADFCTIETGTQAVDKALSMAGIPEGVCRIYLFGRDGSIYASRSVYHHSSKLSPSIEVYADKDKYEPFEKVALTFNLKDGQGNPFRDRFCLSVRDTRSQGNILADDLRTSLLLSSDLKGLIEDPSWYFDTDGPERDEALDLLMLVQGWERYDWQTMTGQKEFRERHRIEENLTLNGWVMNSSGKKPMDSIEVVAALMPTDKTMSETYSYKTDSSGYFGFDIGADFYDKARFSISAQPKRKRLIGPDARIVFDRSMSPAIRAFQPQELVFTGLISAPGKKNRKKDVAAPEDDLETLISMDNGIVLPEVEIDEERMYIDYFTFTSYDVVKDVEVELDKGDYSTDLYGYLLDKGYDVFIDIRDIRKEYTKTKGQKDAEEDGEMIIKLINGYEPFFYIHDENRYLYTGTFANPMTVDSRDVKSLIIFDRPMFVTDILTQCPLFMDSPIGRNYLTDIMTEDDDDSCGGFDRLTKVLNTRMILVDVQVKAPRELTTRKENFNINKRLTTVDGYSRPYAFYSPEYPNGPIPGDVDYRRTLYWNPNVVTDSTGTAQVEFYNNSYSTRFNISGAGITASGIPYILNQNW